MGDILQSGRLLKTLALRGQVHLCVDISLAAWAQGIYPFLQVHGIHAHGAAAALGEDRPIFSALKSIPFAQVYNLNFSGLNYSLSRLFDPAVVRGHRMENGQAAKDRWVELAFRWTGERRVAPLNLVDFWAFFAPDPLPPERVNPPAAGKGGGIGVVMAGRASRRSLPPETLARIVASVYRRYSSRDSRAVPIVLLGSKQEFSLARRLMRLLPEGILRQTRDLVGKTTLEDMNDVISGLDVLLTPDTGLMHLATHLGTPVEAFFLSSAWCFETGPYGLGHTVWQAAPTADVHCMPCLENRPCRYPEPRCAALFAGEDLAEALAGKTGSPVPGILCLKSGFDSLGVIYEARGGVDPLRARRNGRRALVGEWLGLERPAGAPFPPGGEEMYQERDWMLPDRSGMVRYGE